jgi:hypothetical protein
MLTRTYGVCVGFECIGIDESPTMWFKSTQSVIDLLTAINTM